MARKAREKALYSTYWIEQTCPHTPFFNCDEERSYFLSCLKRSQQQYGFLLLGYQLSTHGYQLILYDNGNDITKMMRTLNIEYALKVNRPTFKLKERFKSKIITDSEALLKAIKDLTKDQDCNPFNSYSNFCTGSQCIIDDTIAMAIFGNNRESYTAYIRGQMSLIPDALEKQVLETHCSKDCLPNMEAAQEHLKGKLEELGMGLEDLLKDKEARNGQICFYRMHAVLSLKELGILFGGMSESAISKIIRKHIAKNTTI